MAYARVSVMLDEKTSPERDPDTAMVTLTLVDKIWTRDDAATFLAKAPTHLHLPF